MATKREEARDALNEGITDAMQGLRDSNYELWELSDRIERLANAYALVNKSSSGPRS